MTIDRFKYSRQLSIIHRNVEVFHVILKITKHARDKMSALAINGEMARTAIKRGSKFRTGGGKLLAVYSFFTVVYRALGNDTYKIITLYENK